MKSRDLLLITAAAIALIIITQKREYIRLGDKSKDVESLQEKVGMKSSGVYDTKTKDKVLEVFKDSKYLKDDDGTVDKRVLS